MTIKKILIGIDDSKYAEHAAKYGFEIARKFDAAVGLVNIVEPALMPPMTPGSDPILGMPAQGVGIDGVDLLDLRKDQSAQIVAQTIKRFAKDVKVTHFTEFGDTADGIITCSKEFKADLIVIGTHNRSGIDRLLMGSVAEHVVRHSDIPVLVVPISQ
jgi:nucleotide-binding universal stress UspA family protein